MKLEERIKLLEERIQKAEAWKKQAETLKSELTRANEEYRKLQDENNAIKAEAEFLKKSLEAYSNLDKAIRDIIELHAFKPSTERGLLTIDKYESDLEVLKHREKVTAEESTLRGQIGLLISEGELDKNVTTRTIARKLRDLGFTVPSKGLQGELTWFTRNRILQHTLGSDGSHSYKVNDKTRIIVKDES